MKQHITQEQLNELSEAQLQLLRDWQVNRGYWRVRLPTIGQMIEFLDRSRYEFVEISSGSSWVVTVYEDHRMASKVISTSGGNKKFYSQELCDSLWEAVKYSYETKHNS